ncbi:MAG: hypothetical protein AAB534_01750 [Patescibacteria group bacterium]
MPVLQLQWSEHELCIAAHERLFCRLECMFQTAKGRKGYEDIQKQGNGLSGFVIVSWEESDDPKQFAWDLAGDGLWHDFGDETVVENPPMCAKLQTLFSHLTRLRAENPNMRIGVAFWRHPEADNPALEKYEKMTGFRFPGSPRQ